MRKANLLLMLLGVASMVGAIFTAIKTSKKEEVEKKKIKEDETKYEKVIRKVRTYAPTIALALATIFCFTGASIISINVAAGTSAVLQTTNKLNERYHDRVRQYAGKKREHDMDAEAVGEFTKDEDFKKARSVKIGDGETKFYDILGKVKFEASIPMIRSIEDELNEVFDKSPKKNLFIPINTFYRKASLPTIKGGEYLGFNKVDGPVNIGFYPTVLSDGSRCIVLTYRIYPKWRG